MSKEHDLKPKMLFYKNVQRIVESLKMIAAVKSKQFMYKNKHAKKFLSSYQKNLVNYHFPFNNEGDELHILVGANKGLCGNYLSSLNNLLKEESNLNLNSSNKEKKWIFVGNKLPSLHKDIKKDQLISTIVLDYHREAVQNLINTVLTLQPNSITVYVWDNKEGKAVKKRLFDYQVANSDIALAHTDEIMDEEWIALTHQQILFGTFVDILTEAIMMEETCRLYAMDQAVRNGDKIIADLKNKINQARQQGITTELIEIISGCEYAN